MGMPDNVCFIYTLFVLKYKCWITYVDNQIVFLPSLHLTDSKRDVVTEILYPPEMVCSLFSA